MYIRALCLSLVLVVAIKVNVSAYCCFENRSRRGDDFHSSLLLLRVGLGVYIYVGLNMVNKCAAYGCRSGYKKKDVGEKGGDEKVTFHSFPLQNKELCDRWLRANPRKDFVPTTHSRLCSLHFTPNDFVEVHTDSNKRRDKSRGDEKLVKRYLKDDAVPSIFPSAPQYLSTAAQPLRTTHKATSASRRQHEARSLEDMEASFRQEDISKVAYCVYCN